MAGRESNRFRGKKTRKKKTDAKLIKILTKSRRRIQPGKEGGGRNSISLKKKKDPRPISLKGWRT